MPFHFRTLGAGLRLAPRTRRLFLGLVGGTSSALVATFLAKEAEHAESSGMPAGSGSVLLKRWLKENGVSVEGSETVGKVYSGPIVHSNKFGPVEILEEGVVGVSEDGKILFVFDESEAKKKLASLKLGSELNVCRLGKRFLIPGFVDGHAHAPQHTFTGTGLDLPLLQWLMTYTFPAEAKFKDPDYAKTMYRKAVMSHLKNGSTTVSYFATIHLEASKELANIVEELGQRAYVGKVNMDRNSPDYYCETTKGSLRDTMSFVQFIHAMNNPLVTAVITPRFVPSCTPDLMRGLGIISRSFGLPVQSHMSESIAEVKWVADLHPDCKNYGSVYDKYDLFHENTYMAHCIHCGSSERDLVLRNGVGIVHCPLSNFSIASGLCNVREWVEEGHIVGLGTDVSGGYSPSILTAIRHGRIASIEVARKNGFEGENAIKKALTFDELFFLATLGGAQVLGLDDKIGNFQVGKEFDALVVDAYREGGPICDYENENETTRTRFEKFLTLGDDRNITEVYVKGKQCI
jgi:guanine deaminase|eukprot:g589.t1